MLDGLSRIQDRLETVEKGRFARRRRQRRDERRALSHSPPQHPEEIENENPPEVHALDLTV